MRDSPFRVRVGGKDESDPTAIHASGLFCNSFNFYLETVSLYFVSFEHSEGSHYFDSIIIFRRRPRARRDWTEVRIHCEHVQRRCWCTFGPDGRPQQGDIGRL